ncbi:hypothetical protein ALTER154_30078 [Alteromonas sp. 154]|nr:hypothetical protein ALTER154_30078 [Alteromonas sp. 154]
MSSQNKKVSAVDSGNRGKHDGQGEKEFSAKNSSKCSNSCV